MLRIHTSTNGAAAKQYYTQGLSTPDYYTQKGQEIGHWGGKGAELLSLFGGVEQKQFFRLADNQHPQTGEQLTPRNSTNRRVGYDFTFNAPKSLSIAYAMGDFDTKRIIRHAFEAAVTSTMSTIEADMQVRVRKNGANHNRTTANMVWASFTHDTSRPMDDGFADPHLHTHAFAFNVTKDHEGWKAGQFGAIKRDGNFFEALFHNQLAASLQKEGFAITPTKDRWELTGISREVINAFSRRTAQIEAIAKEQNITSTALKSSLAATTRNNKQTVKPWDEIKQNWHDRFYQPGQNTIESLRHAHTPFNTSSQKAVSYAIDHVFERQSVARARYVTRIALKHGVGSVDLEEIKTILHEQTLSKQVNGETHLTTPAILHEEQSMLHLVKSGRGAYKPLAVDPFTIKSDFLNEQQRDVIHNVLASTDRVTSIIGRAGVGKTTIMTEIADNIRTNGKTLFAFAPSAEASRNVLRSEGFDGADTIARLLIDTKLQSQIKNQIVYIDEAGLVGTKTLNRVLQIAKDQHARVILTGDPKQHNSVERGDALRILEKNAGMQTYYLNTIVRQKRGIFRRAVDAISKGNLEVSLDKLTAMDAFKEIIDTHDRYEQLADEYTKSIITDQSVLVVAPTHKECESITTSIRERLRMAGLVGKTETDKTVLKSLSFTEIEKAYSGNYSEGQTIQFTQNVSGFSRGEAVTVVEPQQEHQVVVKRSNGEHATLPLAHAKRFEVYESKTIPLSKGDSILITQNGFTKYSHHRLNNGSHYQIKSIKKNGEITLNNGWQLDAQFGHFKHGYVSTSHASQGKTVDKVLIGQSSDSFGKASTLEQFYVSVSRGKHDVSIYTNNIATLKEQLTKSQYRMAATELITPAKPSKSWFGALKVAISRYRQTIASPTKPAFAPSKIQPNRQ